MKLIPVNELPERNHRTGKKSNLDCLQEFLKMNVRYAKLDVPELDYVHPFSAYTSTLNSVKRFKLPVAVYFINGDVYLANLEMEETP